MFELRPVPYDHPDARALTERAQEFYVELYGGPDDDPLTSAELSPPHGGFVVGYLGDEPVAMGGWAFDGGLGAGVVKIRRMFVDAQVRRRGLAGALLRWLEGDAAQHGATVSVLATGRPQQAAIAFYRRHHYEDIAPFGYYSASDQIVCLGKELTAAEAVEGQPTG